MEHMETGRIDETQQGQPNDAEAESSVELTKSAQAQGGRREVPCCCPGCFSFDF